MKGWFQDPYRHYLAGKGIGSTYAVKRPSPEVQMMLERLKRDRQKQRDKLFDYWRDRIPEEEMDEDELEEWLDKMEDEDEYYARKRRVELIPGGRAKGIPDNRFDPVQLRKGIKVEMEHTTDPRIAKEIAKDHLRESPRYYVELEKMEKRLEAKR